MSASQLEREERVALRQPVQLRRALGRGNPPSPQCDQVRDLVLGECPDLDQQGRLREQGQGLGPVSREAARTPTRDGSRRRPANSST